MIDPVKRQAALEIGAARPDTGGMITGEAIDAAGHRPFVGEMAIGQYHVTQNLRLRRHETGHGFGWKRPAGRPHYEEYNLDGLHY